MKGNKGKAPSVQWYYKDWLSDKKLQMASSSTRGVWMNLLMYMIDCSLNGEECEAGELILNTRQICQLGGCSEAEANQFVEEALMLKFCDISVTGHDIVTLMSRRLSRDDKERRKSRERKRKQRQKESNKNEVTNDVTQKSQSNHTPSPFPTPSPTSKEVKDKKKTNSRKSPPKKFTPPSLSEVTEYFTSSGYTKESAETFFRYYENGTPPWHDGKGNPVKSWKQKAIAVWFKPENMHVEGKQPWHA